jgi:WD40 repeat protein
MKVVFSPNGERLHVSSRNEIQTWDVKDDKVLFRCPGQLFAVSGNSQTFITKSTNNTFQIWESKTGLELHLDNVNPDSYDLGNRIFISVDNEKKLMHIKDVFNVRPTISLNFRGRIEDEAIIDNWAISPDGRFVAIAFYFSIAGHDKAWGMCVDVKGDNQFGFEVNRFTHSPMIDFARYHPLLAVEKKTESISLYQLNTGKSIRDVVFKSGGGRFLRIGPKSNGKIVVHYTRDSLRIIPQSTHISERVITESNAILDVPSIQMVIRSLPCWIAMKYEYMT